MIERPVQPISIKEGDVGFVERDNEANPVFEYRYPLLGNSCHIFVGELFHSVAASLQNRCHLVQIMNRPARYAYRTT